MDDMDKVIEELGLVYEYIRKEVHDIASCKCRMLDKVRDSIALLQEQPEVVRCKDCENNIGGRCRNLDLWVEIDPDWYCADGERRDEND